MLERIDDLRAERIVGRVSIETELERVVLIPDSGLTTTRPTATGINQSRQKVPASTTRLASSCCRTNWSRTAPDPDAVLLEFLRSTYAAAAHTGHWDRKALDR